MREADAKRLITHHSLYFRAMIQKIDEAVSFVRSRSSMKPRVGVVLGSGLGNVVDAIDVEAEISYADIPGAKASTVVGHAGKMILGRVGNTPVVALAGRMHFYEGHEMPEVILLSRVIGRLGIEKLIVTNAAGGVNTSFKAGDLMLISDHINFSGVNPLRGPNIDDLGPRFPDMTEAYPTALRNIARDVAKEQGLLLQEGVYLFLSGPTYETPAEIRAFRTLGADAVGMSTVPEVIAMAHMNIQCLGISCITNMAAGVLNQKLSHVEVMETTQRVQKEFTALMLGIIERI
jgi:purine-nucleoside phosphorylase